MSDLIEALNAELALIAELPYRVPIHHLARRARDEILELRARCALHDDLEFVSKNELTATRDAALEEAAQACDLRIGAHASVDWVNACMSCIAAIRVLKEGP